MSSDSTSASPALPRLEMRGVCKRFGATRALDRVALRVRPGEVMALVGENGAGKSTLMKVLSGAHPADQGELFLDGQPYAPRNPLHARSRGVAMIYQELSLAPHLSVMENILLGVEPSKRGLVDWREMRSRTAAALEQVGIDVPPDRRVSTLSIAQQQLVEIARAVALDCRILVFDEPTSSLALQDIERLFALIRMLSKRDISIVYISHFLEEVREISDRYTVLRDGQTVGEGETAGSDINDIITLMVGRNVENLYPRSQRTPGEVVLEVNALSGRDKPVAASFQLCRGEILGIAGLVGAGRTEMVRTLFGLDRATGGGVSVDGDFGRATPRRRWRQGVGMVSEDRKREGLAVQLSIADNMTLSHLGGLGPAGLVLPRRQRRACLPWIDRIPIKCQSAAQPVQALSGGNQQKVALARLLHADADILLLDEPTRGIDVGSKAQVYQLIDRLAVEGGGPDGRPKAVVMVSSYLPELLGVCDRIGVMCRGELQQIRPVAEWDERQLMACATGQEGTSAHD